MLKQTKLLFISKSIMMKKCPPFYFNKMMIEANIKYFSSKHKYKNLCNINCK